jgi:hypothetical protein
MKRILAILVVVLMAAGVQPQNVMNKGDLLFNPGLGGPYNYGVIPTINFSGEVGVIPTGKYLLAEGISFPKNLAFLWK